MAQKDRDYEQEISTMVPSLTPAGIGATVSSAAGLRPFLPPNFGKITCLALGALFAYISLAWILDHITNASYEP